MNRIIKIGLDVHTTNYTICIEEPLIGGEKNVYVQTQIKPELRLLINVINTFKANFKDDNLDITLGYEAGCLGYSLYKDLKAKGYNCIILTYHSFPLRFKAHIGIKMCNELCFYFLSFICYHVLEVRSTLQSTVR